MMLSGSGVGLGLAPVFGARNAAGFAPVVWLAPVFDIADGVGEALGLGCTTAPWPPLAFDRTIGSSFWSF